MPHTDEAMTDRDRLHADYVTAVADANRDDASRLATRIGLTPTEVDAHFQVAGHAHDEWVPDEFEDFAALPPGRFDPRVFDQSTWWVDMLRRPHAINDRAGFTDEHLQAVIGFVQREGWRWIDIPDLFDEANPDAEFSIEDYRTALSAAIDATPLMVALRAEANWRNLTAS